ARAAAPSAITTSAASWRAASAAAAAIPSSASDSRRKSAPMARRWPAGLGVVRGGVVGEGLVPLALVLAVALALLVLEQVVLLGMRLLVEFLVGHAPSMPQTSRLESPSRTEGRSSIGRAPVSKTGGCRFESCRPCGLEQAETRVARRVSASLARPSLYRLKPVRSAGDWRPLARNWRPQRLGISEAE